MSPTLKSLGIELLSVDERVRLADEIWTSIVEETKSAPMTETQRQTLKHRLAPYEADPKAGSCWDAVKARLRVPR